jgi:hypothetical protein
MIHPLPHQHRSQAPPQHVVCRTDGSAHHHRAPEQQLDLFSDDGVRVEQPLARRTSPAPVAADLDDAALIAAIPESALDDSSALVAEAGRRHLAAAVPALAALCRRFAGFGIGRAVPEQAAALEALAVIGGRDATRAVAQMIERAVVGGPTLKAAVSAAARLHDRTEATSAACALGQMGRAEARAMLKRLLRDEPSEQAIESVSSVADEECMILLGRIARSTPDLADAALDALENIDHPRAGAIVAAIRHIPPS